MRFITIFLSLLISAQTFSKTVELENTDRERIAAKILLPRGYKKAQKLPIIISMHGYGGNAKLQKFYIRLKKYQNKFKSMVLLPQGLKDQNGKNYWNASEYCCDFWKKQNDDVAYINSLLDQIRNNPRLGKIDENRIFVLGYSNGGFFAKKLACSNEINIAGVVSISGTSDLRDKDGNLLDALDLDCDHNRPIPVLHVHGTDDQTISYDGKDNGKTGHLGALDYLSRWANHNNCQSELISTNSKSNSTNFVRGRETEHFKFNNCEAKVEHYRLNGGAHFNFYKKKFVKKIMNFLFSI